MYIYEQIETWFLSVDPLAEDGLDYSACIYAFKNPIILKDPDGRWCDPPEWTKSVVEYTSGVVNAVSSNILGGALRGNPDDFGAHAEATAYGQQAGDVVSIGIGLLETTLSVIGLGAEAAIAPISGGSSALAVPGTVALGLHGSSKTANGIKNIFNPTKVEANKKPTSNSKTSNSTGNSKSLNQLQKTIEKGQGPKYIRRFKSGKIKGEQDHVHFKDGKHALNKDGTWKHGGRNLSNAESKFLKDAGWKVPNE